jgi:glycosyltransferase involved in cell wall biosynthesis
MILISVIIPTLNRYEYLTQAVESSLNQSLRSDSYEIIVVDNGSVDKTAAVVEEINKRNDFRIKYIYEPAPGLHNGRHRGAKKAKGDILVFADDDIIATQGWLRAIQETFKDPAVALVGGKILPKWEGDVPDWIDLFNTVNEYGWTIGHLSLLDFGDSRKQIPAGYVYGCNFSIRKSVLYECGGFHPDAMPQKLIKYRGDGETALSRAIEGKCYKVIYEPKATVYHCVPRSRLTLDYFCQRAFNQGVSDSYTEIRRNSGVRGATGKSGRGGIINRLIRIVREKPVQKKVRASYLEGKEFHRKSVEADPEILSYVMRETYF